METVPTWLAILAIVLNGAAWGWIAYWMGYGKGRER